MRLRLIATATFGLESIVEREIHALGYEDTMVENGRIYYNADEAGLCRSNLWLRSADRVLIEIGSFRAESFEQLFQGVKAIPWPEWLPKDASFPVSGRSVKSKLHSVPDCQAITKKAIVESMKTRYHLERFPETGPLFDIEVSLLEDMATITLDSSGDGLHKRGYRPVAGPAPIKETLAAGMISLSRWQPGRPFLDPFAGSGTIPIEAALIGCNMAPGVRRRFLAETWPVIPKTAWQNARQEASDLGKPGEWPDVTGSDADPASVEAALASAAAAGLAGKVRFLKRDVKDVRLTSEYGVIVTNPPYGERLGDTHRAEQIYKEMRRVFSSLPTWSFFVISPHVAFEKFFGRQASKKRRLYNGNIPCTFYQYFGPLPPRNGGQAATITEKRQD